MKRKRSLVKWNFLLSIILSVFIPVNAFAAGEATNVVTMNDEEIEIVAEFSFNELECIIASRELSEEELIGLGYNEDYIAYINSDEPEKELKELGRMPYDTLKEYGYTDEQIALLRNYDGETLSLNASIVDGAAECSGYIGKMYRQSDGAGFRIAWSWSAQPHLLNDAVTIQWVAYKSSGESIGSVVGNCSATIGLSNGSNRYYSKSNMNVYEASDAIKLEFNMGTTNAYAKTGNLDVYITVGSNNLDHVDVQGIYYHQHREGTWSLGLPPGFSISAVDMVYSCACSGSIR